MPSVSKRRVVHEGDSDSDLERVEFPQHSSPPTSSSASPNKRARIEQRNGGPVDDDDDDDDDDDESVDLDNGTLPEADFDAEAEKEILDAEENYEITGDIQPFAPGAIVRIKLKNFVTYEKVLIKPGPSLNMIIGPNGSGKSSIVCAICLGLGWSPNHLGRAEAISEYVKHGTQEAFIEIELQGHEGERNPYIKRKIIRENNGSSWWLNNKQSNLKEINTLVKSFNIQIDNLCQFLPQDRVSQFSKLRPPMRLLETERAAASADMLESHKTLIKLDGELSTAKEGMSADKEALKQLEARQAVLQQDVERLRERQEVQAKIKHLERIKPYIQYRDSKNTTKNAQRAKEAAKRELEILVADMVPAMERPKQKKRYKECVQAALRERQSALEDKEGDVSRQKNRVIQRLEREFEEQTTKIRGEETVEDKRKEDVKKCKRQIEHLKRAQEQGPPEIDITELNARIQAKGHEIRAQTKKSDEMKREIEHIHQGAQRVNENIRRAEVEITRLMSTAGQRENMLRDSNRDAYRAWMWYQDNKDEFSAEIYGPPILNCSVTNMKLVNAIESLIANANFTCQNSGDYDKFIHKVFGKPSDGGLGLANVSIKDFSRSPHPTLQSWERKYSKELVASLGFDGVALDFVEGPDAVLNMLCHDAVIQNTPVSAVALTQEQNEACEAAGMNRWIGGPTSNSCSRRYGITSVKVTYLGKPKYFNTQQVDLTRKSELEAQINELKYQLEEVKKDMATRNAVRNEIGALTKELSTELDAIKEEKNTAQIAISKYNTARGKLSAAEDRLRDLIQSGEHFNDTMKQLESGLEKLALKRAQAAIDYIKLVGELVDLNNNFVQLRLRYVEAYSDEQVLEAKNKTIIRRKAEKEREIEGLIRVYTNSKRETRALKQSLDEMIADLTADERDLIAATPPEKKLEDVEDEIQIESSRLGLIHEGNPNAIRLYEERAVKIKNLQEKVSKMEASLEERIEKIDKVRRVWEPRLEALAAKISTAFSYNFRKIGCVGEVRLAKSEEGFDKWALDILVKFRESEKLKILDDQRQSGGERAVSTVFYLMALQSMAQSPFRVVDEINQGMDPRNERVVHHRMVNVACQEHTSQYFLITPKLLSDLMYHPRMKIHNVHSGEWIGQGMKPDFSKYIKIGLRLKGAVNGSTNGVKHREASEDE